MSHYFKEPNPDTLVYFDFITNISGNKIHIKSSSNMFSKDSVDYGTRFLLNTIQNHHKKMSGKVLDLGCGYGIIGIFLKIVYPSIDLVMSDLTKSSIKLTNTNIESNNLEGISVVKSNVYDNISDSFDYIITNPPIKAGKSVLMRIINDGINKLNINGSIILVIKKKHGKDSTKKQMEKVYGNCEVLKRDKGYYILRSIKN